MSAAAGEPRRASTREVRPRPTRLLALGKERAPDVKRALGRALALDLNRRLLDHRAVQDHLRAALTVAPGYSAERALAPGAMVTSP